MAGDKKILTLCNVPPTITSTPSTVAEVGVQYVYDVEWTDPDNPQDVVCFLSLAPQEMTIDGNGNAPVFGTQDGLVEWVPSATGDYDVEVGCEDGEYLDGFGADFQSYTISVSGGTPPPPPPPSNPCPTPDTCYDIAWYCVTPGVNCGPIDPLVYDVQVDNLNRSLETDEFYDSDGQIGFATHDAVASFHTVTVLDENGDLLPVGPLNSGSVPEGTMVFLSKADLEAEAIRQGVDDLTVVCLHHPEMVVTLEVFNGGGGYPQQ